MMTSPDKHNMPATPESAEETHTLSACPGCDLIITVPTVPDGHYLACNRCGATISRAYNNSISRVLTLSFTGLLLYLPAIFLPLMTLSSIGIKQDGNVIDSFINFYRNGYPLVAAIVLFTAIIFPFLKLFLPFCISLCLTLNKRPPWLKPSFKFLKHLEEWGMVEVYLLGILITVIKMGAMASISYGTGFFCFIALVLLSMATTVCLDRKLFWYMIDPGISELQNKGLEQIKVKLRQDPERRLTATQAGLMQCHDCGLLVPETGTPPDSPSECPRCHSSVHRRTVGSIGKTWALVLTSLILFLPANTLPIMQVDFLGVPDRSTILDGILYFFKEGSYGLGLIIFAASILVPLFKMVGMLIILQTIRSGKNRFLKQKAKMFRFIEFIGRWSMLDIFVIALLTVLVNFGFLTSIHTAPAATFFCLVVVSTMIAAHVFDPRIMWDTCDPTRSNQQGQREQHG